MPAVRAPWRPWVRVAALLLPLVTCAILAAVRRDVPAATASLVLVVWVVSAAATGDRVAGVLAAVSGGLWFDFFLTYPYHRFAIADSSDVEVTVLLVVIGLVVTELALWGRRQQAQSAQRAGYLSGVLDAARSVSTGDTPPDVLTDVVARQIGDVLRVDQVRFRAGRVHDTRVAVLDHDGVLTREGRSVDVDRSGLPLNEQTALPVKRGDRVLGHFLVTAATRASYPSVEQRRVAMLLADQVASSLEQSDSGGRT